MNHTKIMRLLENAAVFLLIAVALFVLGVSFLHLPDLEDFVYHYLEINRTVQRMIALILLIGSWNLYKRKRAAWLMTLVLLAVNLGFHIVSRHHFVINVLSLCESAIIIVLLLGHKDFNRPWNNVSVKKAVVLASTFLVLMLANVSFGFFNLRHLTDHPVSFFSYVENTFRILFGFEPSINFLPVSGVLYERFIFWFSWICIVGCVVLVLKPLVYNKRVTKKDKEQVLELVRKYGQNPESYLCLEDDKTYFFGQSVEGVVAYGIVKDVVVVLGDPICAPEDFPVMLAEFKAFCVEQAFSVIFLSTTDRYLQFYKMLGFGHVKCGEEARFNLETYNLQGGKAAKVRANINHANKAGVTVKEYKPLEQRDTAIEQEIEAVSKEWLSSKKSSELSFTLGGIGLDNPLDRRYFYARDKEGHMAALIVFIPFDGMRGYMADVTRRKSSAPGGVMQKIMYDAFMTFKEEGCKWGSMGLSPLANLNEGDEKERAATKLLSFAYENLNSFYGFKDLYNAKQHYNPSCWIPGYFIYLPKVMTPQMAYAIIRIQNPKGIMDYVKTFFIDKKKEKEQVKNDGQKKV